MAMKRKNLPEVVPQVFEHEQFGSVRVVILDGKPFFVAIDVCRALGYKNSRKALKDHVDDEDKRPDVTIRYTSSNGVIQNRKTTVINKSGVYSLILDSQLPKAKEFRHWVTSEVLVKIDETGSYSLPKQQVIRIEGEKHFRDFKAQYPEGAVEVKRVLFDLEEYDNGEYDVITIHEVVLHSDKLIANESSRSLRNLKNPNFFPQEQ